MGTPVVTQRMRNLPALVLVVAAIAGAIIYRRYGVEPRYWAGACIAQNPPFGCLPRMAVVWLQGQDLWGWAALVLGFGAFLTRRLALAIAALIVGGAAVVNFNASLGMFGTALGAWSWLRLPSAGLPPARLPPGGERESEFARAAAEPEPMPPRSRARLGD